MAWAVSALAHSKPHVKHATKTAKHDDLAYKIENQEIRDLHGKVVYPGTIDLNPTIDRIARGGSNRHRNDGTSFQNRESHLPRKPAGYYKEYVHPTPGENGPGPQRIIFGQDGDVWYTPDHYTTFKEIKAN
jgi:guanyl-specific ribonuclease Sa